MTVSETPLEVWLLDRVDLSLTVEGHLNPKIIHPQWLAREGLLRKGEADSASISMSADDYSLFNTQDFTTEVTRDTMSMTTRSEEFEPSLREIFSNTLRVLHHTPVSNLTISRFKYWRTNPAAPAFDKGPDWSSLLALSEWTGLIGGVKPRGIAVEGKTLDEHAIPVTLAVEPDDEREDVVYVGCRYDWKFELATGSADLQEVLRSKWDHVRRHADQVSARALEQLVPTPKRTTAGE